MQAEDHSVSRAQRMMRHPGRFVERLAAFRQVCMTPEVCLERSVPSALVPEALSTIAPWVGGEDVADSTLRRPVGAKSVAL